MADGNSTAGGRRLIRNPQDFYGGLLLVAVAAIAFWAAGDLHGIRGFQLGPGTVPRLFAGLLGAMGVAVAVMGIVTEGPDLQRGAARATAFAAVLLVLFLLLAHQFGKYPPLARYNLVAASAVTAAAAFAMSRFVFPGPLLISAAILVFAGCIREAGLVLTSFASIMIAAAASHEFRRVEAAIWAAVLTLFCVLLFRNALKLPLPLWPPVLGF